MNTDAQHIDQWGVRSLIGISVAALALLFWLIYGYESATDDGPQLAWLPSFNAACNGLSTICVLNGLYWIRRGRHRLHGTFMVLALSASALFLVGYIVHHTLHGDTRFLTEGWLRPVYFAILISHILLSMVALPLVLITVFFAALKRWSKHRRLARWTYPIWLYVSITGVLVYYFLHYLNNPTG